MTLDRCLRLLRRERCVSGMEGAGVASMLISRVKTLAAPADRAFLIYAIFKSPDQAAQIVRTAWSGVVDGAARDRPLLRRPARPEQLFEATRP